MPKEIQQDRRMRSLVLELQRSGYVVKFKSEEKYIVLRKRVLRESSSILFALLWMFLSRY